MGCADVQCLTALLRLKMCKVACAFVLNLNFRCNGRLLCQHQTDGGVPSHSAQKPLVLESIGLSTAVTTQPWWGGSLCIQRASSHMHRETWMEARALGYLFITSIWGICIVLFLHFTCAHCLLISIYLQRFMFYVIVYIYCFKKSGQTNKYIDVFISVVFMYVQLCF